MCIQGHARERYTAHRTNLLKHCKPHTLAMRVREELSESRARHHRV